MHRIYLNMQNSTDNKLSYPEKLAEHIHRLFEVFDCFLRIHPTVVGFIVVVIRTISRKHYFTGIRLSSSIHFSAPTNLPAREVAYKKDLSTSETTPYLHNIGTLSQSITIKI